MSPPDALRERVGAVVDEAISYVIANSERLWSKEFRAAVNEFRSRILSLLPAEGPRSASGAEQKEPSRNPLQLEAQGDVRAVFQDGFYAGAESQGWSDSSGCDAAIGEALEVAWKKRAAGPKEAET